MNKELKKAGKTFAIMIKGLPLRGHCLNDINRNQKNKI